MIDQKMLPYVLRRLLDAQAHRGGRFMESDAEDALRYVGVHDAAWKAKIQWLRDEGYIEQHTTIWDALTPAGVAIANTA